MFSTFTQAQSRVSAQQIIVNEYNNNPAGKARVDSILRRAIALEAIWINELNFASSESYYDSAFIYSSSSSPAYEATAYNLSLTRLEVIDIDK